MNKKLLLLVGVLLVAVSVENARAFFTTSSKENPGVQATYYDGNGNETVYDSWTYSEDLSGNVTIGNWASGELSDGTRATDSTTVSTPTNTATPSGYSSCKITASPTSLIEGVRTLRLDWYNENLPYYQQITPVNGVKLTRDPPGTGNSTTLGANEADKYWNDTTTFKIGTYKYTVSFYGFTPHPNAGSRQCGGSDTVCPNFIYSDYQCSVNLTVVEAPTQCNDNVDNGDSEDALIDERDPGCHTDGNPANTATYNSKDNTEANTLADMVPTLSVPSTVVVGNTAQVTAGARNAGGIYAQTNSLVYGWWHSAVDTAATCGTNYAECFVAGGKYFRRLGTLIQPYSVGQVRTLPSIAPLLDRIGTYQFCIIADNTNAVAEGAVGESNNVLCKLVEVVYPPPKVSLFAKSNSVWSSTSWTKNLSITESQSAQLKWVTENMSSCTSANTADFTMVDTDGSSGSTNEVVEPTLGTTKTYTINCVGKNGATVSDSVNITTVDSTVVPPTPVLTPLTLTPSPKIVHQGETSTLTFNTGGRAGCTITRGTLLHTTPTTAQGTTPSAPVSGESTYTLSCANGDSVKAVVKMLPVMSET